MTKSYLNELTYRILGAAIEVHKELGPGLLENVYQRCLSEEFKTQRISFQSQLYVPVNYKSVELNIDLRCDFFVANCIVVEIKAVENIHPLYDAQVLSYMKLLNAPKGILINFHAVNIFNGGQRTYVNELFRDLKD
jgi:GxxExxY protein